MFRIIIRTLLIYLFLCAAMRFAGKRQIGQMRPSELVTAFLLSEIAALPLTDPLTPVTYAIFPAALIAALEVFVPFIANKVPIVKKAIDGVPSILIKNGVPDEKEMKKMRIGIDELLGELRLKDIQDISDVMYAVLEANGQLSVVPKSNNGAVKLKHLGIIEKESGLAHPLVINGRVSKFNMSLTGKDRRFIESNLGGRKIKDVMLMTLDDAGKVSVIPRSGGSEKRKKR